MRKQKQKTKNIIRTLRSVYRLLCRVVYPECCPICDEVPPQQLTGDGVARICPTCRPKVTPVQTPFCMKCGKPLVEYAERVEYCVDCKRIAHEYTQGRAVYVYRGAIIGTMHRLKYNHRQDYAVALARDAYERLGSWIERIAPQVIVPIPLHKKRKKTRGYNQAQLLAAELSRLTGIPMDADLLQRTMDTRPQRELSASERKNNLKKAFQMSKKSVQLEKVLLIDDIYTTGSTVDAVARVLKSGGVRQVYVLCVCIGGDKGEE